MTSREPEVAGDVDEQDWPAALNRALEKNRQLDAQIVREREEAAARTGALVAKLGGKVVLTAAEISAAQGTYTEYLDDGSLRLTVR
ncbi:hypothetical protein [Streptomyces sp. STR69]|uniref:hypothetical protein n=1 Tax=Streptomyces sp. STR69 TaxID=1796942 RepID=UPI0021C9A74E|nr:hypothetical protein [Streptomyces sp. STR69]